MKLSIIIPVYNVEKTFRRCIDSVLSQGIDNYEILIIDDGSTDNSGNLADKAALLSNNIKVFHKPNGGLSDARNYGISRATGDYITFVDSDDFVENNTYAKLMPILDGHKEYDILEYPVLQNPGCKNERIFNPGTTVYDNALDWLSTNGLEHCWAWNKIYRKELFSNVRFPKGKIYEDVYNIASLIKLNPIIATTDKGMYYYCWNKSGIAAKETLNGLTSLLEAQISLTKELNLNTREKRWHRLYLNMLTSQLYSYRKTGKILLWPQRIQIKSYAGNKDWIKAVMLNLFGLKLSCKIFKLISRQ